MTTGHQQAPWDWLHGPQRQVSTELHRCSRYIPSSAVMGSVPLQSGCLGTVAVQRLQHPPPGRVPQPWPHLCHIALGQHALRSTPACAASGKQYRQAC